MKRAIALLAVFGGASAPGLIAAEQLFRIEVVDKGNRWAVPLVELRTTHNECFITDNRGIIAFDLPELMGTETWFFVEGHGYSVPADGFGYRGVRLTPQPGKSATIEVTRELPAKRLGRITGAGLFAESQRFGLDKDWKEQGIVGCDSVQIAEHNGRLFWAWGDTSVPGYPLGLFQTSSGTTRLRPLQSFEPPVQLAYDYFRNSQGKVRNVAEMPGEGPTWLSAYVSLPDSQGKQQLVATYSKIRGFLEAYEVGLCVWNDQAERFEKLKMLWTKSDSMPERPPCPEGHPAFWQDEEGVEWLLFGDPFPKLKCRPTFEAWQDPTTWQTLEPQATVPTATGDDSVKPHSGSIAWNAYRKKWVTVFMQHSGKPSTFGELWYAESDSPLGPWGGAVKVVTHNNYTFYNPRLHPELTPPDSPILLFEGTYTAEFADRPVKTPRFDYNQVLYRLDLDDRELFSDRQ